MDRIELDFALRRFLRDWAGVTCCVPDLHAWLLGARLNRVLTGGGAWELGNPPQEAWKSSLQAIVTADSDFPETV